ncbi:MAG: glutathione S-transferase family protein [Candidatus Thiodiazotropha taylori]|nr:glutathione S-transferase family protein [Candidatus Thiodiazotropha taylori]MCG7911461.1 glutathione S-transferase family protein [Candidatus Thiodiazotropha taylori]MCG7962402.1 glutathione S-transferase family protein [Candidatus Thiodiazotropha endolucinida]MCW4228441.1 glutathione S-transferase family protein [Candidatus Thiodiazotropha taylori]
MSSQTLLYDKEECPFCWRVRMALHHCKVEYQRLAYDEYEAEWSRLTPSGTVPVLKAGEMVLHDSSVMLEYLDERYGGLWPGLPEQRAEARWIALYADSEVGRPVRDLVFQRRDKPPAEWDEEVIANAMGAWHQAMPYLEECLAQRSHFVSTGGITDFILATRFGLAMAYDMPSPRSPGLMAWFDRIAESAEFRETAPKIVMEKLDRGWLR